MATRGNVIPFDRRRARRQVPVVWRDAADGRYDRQSLIAWWDQDRLRAARVVVVGAGALGNELLKLLALTGVGSLVVVDFDSIARSNLSRTVLFRDDDVGMPKALVAAERAGAINPDVRVVPLEGDVGRDLGLGALRQADVVLAGLDSVNARFHLNRRCLLAGVPWLNVGISETQFQVTRYVPGSGSCYECTFSEATLRRFRERYSCTGLMRRTPDRAQPTTAVTASVAAGFAVHDALRLLHDPSTGLAPGHRLTCLLDGPHQAVDELPRNEACAAHEPAAVPSLRLDRGPAELSAAEVARASGRQGAGAVALGWDLVEAFRCPGCGRETLVGRPKATVYEDELRCPACGAERQVEIAMELGPWSPFWDRPLARLGVADREILRVVDADGAGGTWVEIGGDDPWQPRGGRQ